MQLFNVSFICYRFLLGILFIFYFIFLFSLHSPVSWIWPSPLLPLLLSPRLWSQRSPLPQEACLPELPPSFWHSPTWRQRVGKRVNKCSHSCQEVSFFLVQNIVFLSNFNPVWQVCNCSKIFPLWTKKKNVTNTDITANLCSQH